MIKTYIFLEPSQPACSPDFEMQQMCANKSQSELEVIFQLFFLKNFEKYNIVKYKTHEENSLDGYLIIEVEDYEKVLEEIKELITLTDTLWGEPYYYYAVFTFNGNIEKFSLESVNPIIYNGRRGKNNIYFEKLLAYNDFN